MINHTQIDPLVDKATGYSIIIRAEQEMNNVSLPTRFGVDIFNKEYLSNCKMLFSSSINDTTDPCFLTNAISWELHDTIESYFVDKNISGSITSDSIDTILHNIEKKITTTSDLTLNDREDIFLKILCSLDVKDAERKRQRREFCFMKRVAMRLNTCVLQRLHKELPLPNLPSIFLKKLEININGGSWFPNAILQITSLTPEQKENYSEYCKTLLDLRDKRVLEILRTGLEEDKKVRKINPDAPLTYLCTLKEYEDTIYMKRRSLYLKTAAISLGVFCLIIAGSLCTPKIKQLMLFTQRACKKIFSTFFV